MSGAYFRSFILPVKQQLPAAKKDKDGGKALQKACINGSSELMSNISSSLISVLYNLQLLKFAGEDGVAAYGTLMYIQFILLRYLLATQSGLPRLSAIIMEQEIMTN